MHTKWTLRYISRGVRNTPPEQRLDQRFFFVGFGLSVWAYL